MMRTTVSTQPQIIIVACCITLHRSAYDTAGNIRSITKDGTVTKSFGYTNASWPDLLTSVTANGTTKDVLYEGQSRTSDLPSSGNPYMTLECKFHGTKRVGTCVSIRY